MRLPTVELFMAERVDEALSLGRHVLHALGELRLRVLEVVGGRLELSLDRVEVYIVH